MKRYLGSVAMAAMAILASPATGAQFNVSLTGVLTSQLNESGLFNTGVDPNLAVGDTITLTASFDSSRLIAWGDTGYSVVGFAGMPTSGNSFFRIEAPGMTWKASDDVLDGIPFFTYDYNVSGQPRVIFNEGAPAIIIQGDKVVGMIGTLSPSGSSARPSLDMGAYIGHSSDKYYSASPDDPVTHTSNFATLFGLGDTFSITAPNGMYFNNYNTPGFTGVWDFANSSVVDPPSPSDVVIASAVPEPATWAMFLLGFGAVGFTLRRRGAGTLAII